MKGKLKLYIISYLLTLFSGTFTAKQLDSESLQTFWVLWVFSSFGIAFLVAILLGALVELAKWFDRWLDK